MALTQRAQITRYWTREAVILAIQFWVERHGDIPKKRDWEVPCLDPDWPPATVVKRRFGSWNSAIASAGFKPRAASVASNRQPTIEFELEIEFSVHAKLAEAAEKRETSIGKIIGEVLRDWAVAK